MKEAARASQKKEYCGETRTSTELAEVSFTRRTAFSETSLRGWLQDVRQRRNDDGLPLYKDAQVAVLEKVITRMCRELQQEAAEVDLDDPLLWCVHGGPGTGKTETLKLLKELFGECGWQMGLEYQMAALQAITAQAVGGDTLHHSCGISWSGISDTHQSQSKRVAERVLQWRWLIIDEISMVSSKLLAQVDSKLRDTVRRCHTMKTGAQGLDRAFGGINVLMVGDFWQLDPPAGGFLGHIPVEFMLRSRQFAAKPDVAHWQSILWGRGANAVQGVTELTFRALSFFYFSSSASSLFAELFSALFCSPSSFFCCSGCWCRYCWLKYSP